MVYGKAINFKITNLDDDYLIDRSVSFVFNIQNIPNLLLTDCYLGKETQYYRPILNISFILESVIFKNNLKINHITNILLFIFSLYAILILLSKLKFNTTILKFLILLFAIHPVLSSVPVWIPARNDTLLTIFFMLSLINSINYLKTNKNIFLFLHLFFFILSLFTKETTILLIFVYPLLIYCFNFKISKRQILNNIIFILPLLIIYFILRHFAVRSVDISIYFTNIFYYIKNIVIGTMLYIEQIFYPANVSVMLYDITPTIQIYIVNAIVFVSLIFIYYKKIVNRKFIIFSLFFSLLAILPTFLQEKYAFFNHRLIISLVGILIILTSILDKILIKYNFVKKYLLTAYIFLFLLFSYCTFIQIDKYKDSFIYWNNAYIDAPNYYLVCRGLAKEYSNKKNFINAKELSLKAIELNNCFDNYLTYAIILFKSGDINSSKNILLQLLQYGNNPLTYMYLSDIYLFEKNYNLSLEYAKKAIEYSIRIDEKIISLENLSKIYSVIGKYEESLNILLELYSNNKVNSNYCYLISMLYEDLKDFDNAKIYILEAIKIDSTNKNYIEQLQNIENKLLTK